MQRRSWAMNLKLSRVNRCLVRLIIIWCRICSMLITRSIFIWRVISRKNRTIIVLNCLLGKTIIHRRKKIWNLNMNRRCCCRLNSNTNNWKIINLRSSNSCKARYQIMINYSSNNSRISSSIRKTSMRIWDSDLEIVNLTIDMEIRTRTG